MINMGTLNKMENRGDELVCQPTKEKRLSLYSWVDPSTRNALTKRKHATLV